MTDWPTPVAASWVDIPAGSPFPLHNLPFGVARRPDGTIGAFVAIGDHALDLGAARHLLDGTFASDGLLDSNGSLNAFAAAGHAAHRAVRERLTELFADPSAARPLGDAMVLRGDLTMMLPIVVGDFVDFYSSLHHATNLGRLFRPDGEPLLENWRRIPVGYHGRSGTIVAADSDIARPSGLHTIDGELHAGPTNALDIELEVGFVVGTGSQPGQPVSTATAEEHLFGLCLVNDWSARDIQAFEYQPLGPFLAKSFATSMSPWIVTLDALAPFRIDPAPQDPPVADHLRTSGPTGFDLDFEVRLQSASMRAAGHSPVVISATDFDGTYWSAAQQIAHMTTNGAHLRPGDLFASGTVSGPTRGSEGSLIELTRRGDEPIELPDGTQRAFLEDGDTVTLEGWAGRDPATRIGLGTVTGTIITAADTPEES